MQGVWQFCRTEIIPYKLDPDNTGVRKPTYVFVTESGIIARTTIPGIQNNI